MKRTAPCPSNWALDRLLLGEAEESVHQHVTQCAECTQRLSELQRSGEDYMASAEAAALRSRIEALESTCRGTPVRASKIRRLFPASMLTATLAAAAAIALLIRAPGPPDEGAAVDLTAKGGEQFELWVERNAITVPLPTEGAARVNETERLQASVGLDSARHVAVLVVTPSGDVVPLVSDGSGHSVKAEARPTSALGPSFRLTEELGVYRVVALFSETPFALDLVEQKLTERSELALEGVVVLERSFHLEPSH